MPDDRRVEHPTRLVILAGAAHTAAAAEWAAAVRGCGAAVPLVLIERRSPATKVRLVRRRLARHGVRTVLGQLLYLAWIATDDLRRVPDVPRPATGPSTGTLGPEVHTVPDINTATAAARIRAARPTLAAVYGTAIIRGETLAALPPDSFNLHTGLTRHHRGLACTFWALAAGHPEHIGVTVHRLTAGIDAGATVAERVLGTDALSRVASMRRLDADVAQSGEALMRDVLLRAARAELAPAERDPSVLGPLHTAPTFCEYRRVMRRLGLR
jgi:formyl transferase-like protein